MQTATRIAPDETRLFFSFTPRPVRTNKPTASVLVFFYYPKCFFLNVHLESFFFLTFQFVGPVDVEPHPSAGRKFFFFFFFTFIIITFFKK